MNSINGASCPGPNLLPLEHSLTQNVVKSVPIENIKANFEGSGVFKNHSNMVAAIRNGSSWSQLKEKFTPEEAHKFRSGVVNFLMGEINNDNRIFYKIAGTPGPDSDIDVTYGPNDKEISEADLYEVKSLFDRAWIDIFGDTSGHTCNVEIASIPGGDVPTYTQLEKGEEKENYRYVALLGVALQAFLVLEDVEQVRDVENFLAEIGYGEAANEIFHKVDIYVKNLSKEMDIEFLIKIKSQGVSNPQFILQEINELTDKEIKNEVDRCKSENPSLYRKNEIEFNDRKLKALSKKMDELKPLDTDEKKVQFIFLETLRHAFYKEMYITEGAYRHVVADKGGQIHRLHDLEMHMEFVHGKGIVEEVEFVESDPQNLLESLLENMVLGYAEFSSAKDKSAVEAFEKASKYENRANQCAIDIVNVTDNKLSDKLEDDLIQSSKFLSLKRGGITSQFFYEELSGIFSFVDESDDDLKSFYNYTKNNNIDTDVFTFDFDEEEPKIERMDERYPFILEKLKDPNEKQKWLEICFPDMVEGSKVKSIVGRVVRIIENTKLSFQTPQGYMLLENKAIVSIVFKKLLCEFEGYTDSLDENEQDEFEIDLLTLLELYIGVSDFSYPDVKERLLKEHRDDISVDSTPLPIFEKEEKIEMDEHIRKEGLKRARRGRIRALKLAREEILQPIGRKEDTFDPVNVL